MGRVYIKGEPLEVERIWRHDEKLIFKFRGIDSISAAESLVDCDVCIPKEERAPLGDDEYYQSDIVGCQVVDLRTGKLLGIVEHWQEYGGPPLLQVNGEKEILIPFAKSICKRIDIAAKRLDVELPEGLDEL